ncbi:hypothetical protein ACP70R_024706 [Stipagrostis hirtigluma subsp. patula]
MEGKWRGQIFVSGWGANDRVLGDAFRRFGRVVDAQVIVNKETGASRGFGFVTFQNQWAADNAIREMHLQELDGRIIEVYDAETRMNAISNTVGKRYGNGGGRGHYCGAAYGSRDDDPPPRPGNCFACGCPGHWGP